MRRDYQKEMEAQIARACARGRKKLLLHSCCAPCSSHVLECLSPYFKITVFYYNPNIYPDEEYEKRAMEQEAFLERFPGTDAAFLRGRFEKEKFCDMAKGLEGLPEGGERCFRCYRMRLGETARRAREMGMDFFATTLSISPLKNAQKLNEIGESLAGEHGIAYLVSDFKKKDGYKRSIELSKEYGLYRQDYCGCVFSRREREKRKTKNRE